MKSVEIRRAFIDYFKNNGHAEVASSPLVPRDDKTLLFANAGMNQFKNLFLGLEKQDYTKATSSQKCVRAGGKHNDLENVGHTARHHTFFEMLGNFSFGDYFKSDAIKYAWDFLTNELKINKDRLYVTVHVSDDEAERIWMEQEGVPKERIFRFDEDNFWRMGDTGPCGPCSEIFFDHAPDGKIPTAKQFEEQDDRFVEIWNLVFMQYYESEKGREDLPNPSIDTGAGLERLSAVMQGVSNNYDADLFTGIIGHVCNELKLKYKDLNSDQITALRVVADHARATTFLMSDGVLPSNEGRGYVLRRIMRRALRYAKTVSNSGNTFAHACNKVIQEMSSAYPELKSKEQLILQNVEDETGRFLTTLDQGTKILEDELAKLPAGGTLSGEIVFRLYDTYGFPVDLTNLMAKEKGFQVNEADFEKHMEEARAKARASWKGQAITADAAHLVQLVQGQTATKFTGYEKTNDHAQVVLLSTGSEKTDQLSEGESGVLILDRTCFYAESGGQVGDKGLIQSNDNEALVEDCQKHGEIFLHHVKVTKGNFKKGDDLSLNVQSSERRQIASNHSATHLLHAALRGTLGEHVTQAGSLVEATRLRFDYTHNKPLTQEEIQKLENWVNEDISGSYDSATVLTDPKSAIEKEGALALFGEKYGDEVRVIKMGPRSTELCGGTHVSNTSQIRLFKIVSEGGVSSGIRRIEALTGDHALNYLLKHGQENQIAREKANIQESWMQFLESDKTAAGFIDDQKNEIRDLRKEIKSLKGSKVDIDGIVSSAKDFSDGKLATVQLELDDRKVLADTVDKIKNKLQSGVVVVIGQGDKTNPVLVAVTKELSSKFKAGALLKEITATMGGKGGGRPDFAQGSVPDLKNVTDGFKKAEELLGL